MIRRLEGADEATLQLNAIEEIANASGQPVSEVRKIYEAEFARLKADAHVGDYLLLFASRRTREVLVRGAARRATAANPHQDS